MRIDLYKQEFLKFFDSPEIRNQIDESVKTVKEARSIFFAGNGGSNSIASHMMEDYMIRAGKKCYAFSDPAMITCFSNDFGYENAMAKWVGFLFSSGDLLIAISSSGKSPNILNACRMAREKAGKIITLSGFRADNTLRKEGDINFHLPVENYGIVECFHQTILHIILDEIQSERK